MGFGDFEDGLGALVDYDGYGFGQGSASEDVRFVIAFRNGGGVGDLPGVCRGPCWSGFGRGHGDGW